MNNPIDGRLADLDERLFMPRELSWLSFNARVLQEAADENVPIIQRLRYLGIFSSNLDEFFRVRVAEIRRLIVVSSGGKRQRAKDLLETIQQQVSHLQREFDTIQTRVMAALEKRHIYIVDESALNQNQLSFVEQYFAAQVLPALEPILLTDELAIPALADESLYLAVDLKTAEGDQYAVMEVPSDVLGRFVAIPKGKDPQGKVYILLDDVIRACLPRAFRGVFDIQSADAYCFKFSRDAELEIEASINESLIEKMASSLRQRRKADAVRFVYDATMPEPLLEHLRKRLGFGRYDSLIPGGRYHNSKDYIGFPNAGPKYLEFKPQTPIRIPELDAVDNIFTALREKDYLLYYPYHPFDYVVDVLKTAAIDPSVTAIKICLYRVASNSQIVDALINAQYNGKRVRVVVELAARFDEQANIAWSERLTEAGIEVIFGIPGLKVHSKLFLIDRMEQGKLVRYSHIGTGNFNEKTARLYTDFTLLTSDPVICEDVNQVFDFLKYNYRRPDYKQLLVSPHTSRTGIMELIDGEIKNAREGFRAQLFFKCNNLVDKQLTLKLYEASQAGVEIRLVIRGMCSLLPGVSGISENIQAISIVDRYLEHPRVYVAHNRGVPKYFIGSADLMTRNIDSRVEVICPVTDEAAQTLLQDVLDQQWNDNSKARVIDSKQGNEMVASSGRATLVRSQETIHRYLQSGKSPRMPKSSMRTPSVRRRRGR
ncbi:polyphosphate kinase 1 [Luminiphilus sp.]|jgi:polyphosphate kinase|nr:polyphosphate kinase 1 [Luminiphilus sp.]MDB2377939.1 polyphosphate kinase 1 [Luminiphilus sp.]